LQVELLGRGFAWLDTGTHESLLQASNFRADDPGTPGNESGMCRGNASRQGWINAEQLERLAGEMAKIEYGHYLLKIARGEE
jgi:glucose-1-phosphate thymidylyltransferase